jgi:hypothetical protein
MPAGFFLEQFRSLDFSAMVHRFVSSVPLYLCGSIVLFCFILRSPTSDFCV